MSVTSDMLLSIGLRSMECALYEDKQYVIMTVSKSMKGSDVMAALVDAGLCLEKFDGFDDLILTFEKGQQYVHHPFYAVMQGVKSGSSSEDATPRFWQWESDGSPSKRKRVASELASDLVEDAIIPSAPKREHGPIKADAEVILLFYCCFKVRKYDRSDVSGCIEQIQALQIEQGGFVVVLHEEHFLSGHETDDARRRGDQVQRRDHRREELRHPASGDHVEKFFWSNAGACE